MILRKGLVDECKGTHPVRSKAKLLICYPYAGLDRPYGSWSLRFPEFLDNRHMNVAKLSALRTSHLYLRETFFYSFMLEAETTPGPQCGRKY